MSTLKQIQNSPLLPPSVAFVTNMQLLCKHPRLVHLYYPGNLNLTSFVDWPKLSFRLNDVFLSKGIDLYDEFQQAWNGFLIGVELNPGPFNYAAQKRKFQQERINNRVNYVQNLLKERGNIDRELRLFDVNRYSSHYEQSPLLHVSIDNTAYDANEMMFQCLSLLSECEAVRKEYGEFAINLEVLNFFDSELERLSTEIVALKAQKHWSPAKLRRFQKRLQDFMDGKLRRDRKYNRIGRSFFPAVKGLKKAEAWDLVDWRDAYDQDAEELLEDALDGACRGSMQQVMSCGTYTTLRGKAPYYRNLYCPRVQVTEFAPEYCYCDECRDGKPTITSDKCKRFDNLKHLTKISNNIGKVVLGLEYPGMAWYGHERHRDIGCLEDVNPWQDTVDDPLHAAAWRINTDTVDSGRCTPINNDVVVLDLENEQSEDFQKNPPTVNCPPGGISHCRWTCPEIQCIYCMQNNGQFGTPDEEWNIEAHGISLINVDVKTPESFDKLATGAKELVDSITGFFKAASPQLFDKVSAAGKMKDITLLVIELYNCYQHSAYSLLLCAFDRLLKIFELANDLVVFITSGFMKVLRYFIPREEILIDEEDVEAQSGADAFGAIATLVIGATGFWMFGKKQSESKINSLVSQLRNVKTVKEGLKDVFSALKYAIDCISPSAALWVVETFPALFQTELTKRQEVIDYIVESAKHGTEDHERELLTNRKERERVKYLFNFVGQLLGEAIQEKQNMSMLSEAFRRTTKARDVVFKLEGAGGRRKEPFVLSMGGQSGVGKSSLIRALVYALLPKYHGTLQPIEGESECDYELRRIEFCKESALYAKNMSDVYWEGLNFDHYFTLFDDYSSVKAGNGAFNPSAALIDLASMNPQQVNKADLPKKGMQFTSEFIFMTSNDLWYQDPSINCPEAFLRRRTLNVKVEVDPVYAKSMGNINVKGHHHFAIDAKKIPADGVSHYVFQLYDPVTKNLKIGKPMKFDDFIYVVRRESEDFFKYRSMDVLDRKDITDRILRIRNGEQPSEYQYSVSRSEDHEEMNYIPRDLRSNSVITEASFMTTAEPIEGMEAHGMVNDVKKVWEVTGNYKATFVSHLWETISSLCGLRGPEHLADLKEVWGNFEAEMKRCNRPTSDYDLRTDVGKVNFGYYIEESIQALQLNEFAEADRVVSNREYAPQVLMGGSLLNVDGTIEQDQDKINFFMEEMSKFYSTLDPLERIVKQPFEWNLQSTTDRRLYKVFSEVWNNEINDAINRLQNMDLQRERVIRKCANMERMKVFLAFETTKVFKICNALFLTGYWTTIAGIGYLIFKYFFPKKAQKPMVNIDELRCLKDIAPEEVSNLLKALPIEQRNQLKPILYGFEAQYIPVLNTKPRRHEMLKVTQIQPQVIPKSESEYIPIKQNGTHANRTQVQIIKSIPKAVAESLEAHGQAEVDKRNRIFANLYRIGRPTTKDGVDYFFDHCYCLGIGDRVIAAPKHIVCVGNVWKPDGTLFEIQQGTKRFSFRFDRKCVVEVPGFDLVYILMDKNCPLFANIVKYMMRYQNYSAYGQFNGLVYQYHNGRCQSDTVRGALDVTNRTPEDLWSQRMAANVEVFSKNAFQYPLNANDESQMISNQCGFSYKHSFGKGACGSPLVSCSNNHTQHLVGIHIAGTADLGFALPLFAEMAEDALRILCPKGAIYEADVPEHAIEAHGAPTFFIPGHIDHLGKYNRVVFTPEKTHLRKSVCYKELFDPISEPAILELKDPRNVKKRHPLSLGVSKYGERASYICKHLARLCARNYGERLRRFCKRNKLRVLDPEEGLNGDPQVVNMTAMNMRSSAGEPWKKFCEGKGPDEKGKSSLFDINDSRVPRIKFRTEGPGAQVLAKVYESEEKGRRGYRDDTLWWDCVKDELRTYSYVPASTLVEFDEHYKTMGEQLVRVFKDTRVFDVAPVDFTINGRRYFLPAFASMMEANTDIGIAVGMDPFSADAHKLVTYLQSVGYRIIAGDYKKFDARISGEFFDMGCEAINMLYDDDEESQLFRRVWTSQLYQRWGIAGDLVYGAFVGNPSGNPGTTMFNCMTGIFILMMAFIRLAEQYDLSKAHPEAFWAFTRPIVFGDDFLLAVSEECPWVTLPALIEVVKEFGMEMTPEDKTDVVEEWKPIERCTFLKCNFRYEDSMWRMCLNKKTIQEMTNWVSASTDPTATTHDKCIIALWMMSWWGKEAFEPFREALIASLYDLHLSKKPIPHFEEFAWQQDNMLGRGFGRTQSTIEWDEGEFLFKNPFANQSQLVKVAGIKPYIAAGVAHSDQNEPNLECEEVIDKTPDLLEMIEMFDINKDRFIAKVGQGYTETEAFASCLAERYPTKIKIRRKGAVVERPKFTMKRTHTGEFRYYAQY
jgi:hypothetical protein